MGIVRQEVTTYSVPHLVTSGLPAVIAYHVVDFVSFRIETFIDAVFDTDENDGSEELYWNGETVQGLWVLSSNFNCSLLTGKTGHRLLLPHLALPNVCNPSTIEPHPVFETPS